MLIVCNGEDLEVDSIDKLKFLLFRGHYELAGLPGGLGNGSGAANEIPG